MAQMKHSNGKAKEIALSVFSVFLFIVTIVGVSYAVYSWQSNDDTANKIATGTITFQYLEKTNGISITNAQPMTDAAGKIIAASDSANGITQGYFDFTVTGTKSGNSVITYEIYSTLDSSSNMTPDELNNVKIYLTDITLSEVPVAGYDGASVPTYASLPAATTDANGKRLYTGTFTDSNLSKSFRLRVFIGSGYTTADVSKTFSMYVNVKTVA